MRPTRSFPPSARDFPTRAAAFSAVRAPPSRATSAATSARSRSGPGTRTFPSFTTARIDIRSSSPRSAGAFPEDAKEKDVSVPPRTIPKIAATTGTSPAKERSFARTSVTSSALPFAAASMLGRARVRAQRSLDERAAGSPAERRESVTAALPSAERSEASSRIPSKARLFPAGRDSTTRLRLSSTSSVWEPSERSGRVQSDPGGAGLRSASFGAFSSTLRSSPSTATFVSTTFPRRSGQIAGDTRTVRTVPFTVPGTAAFTEWTTTSGRGSHESSIRSYVSVPARAEDAARSIFARTGPRSIHKGASATTAATRRTRAAAVTAAG